MRPEAATPREALGLALAVEVEELHELRQQNHEALAAAGLDDRLACALAELAGVAHGLDPSLALELECARVPKRWDPEVTFAAGVEGVGLLRRRVIDGRPSGLHALEPRRFALVVMLDDGGVGWPSPAMSTDELAAFVHRTRQLLDHLVAAQEARARG